TLSFFFQAEDGIRDWSVTGVQTCALPISICISKQSWHTGLRQGAVADVLTRERLLMQIGAHVAGINPVDAPFRMLGRQDIGHLRSEERRVGKESRGRGSWKD